MRIALFGSPNFGKSSLYNRLTGSSAHVGNWAGKTVKAVEAPLKGVPGATVTDLPGTYSIFPDSPDETAALEGALAADVDLFIVVGDAREPRRSLGLLLEVLPLAPQTIFFLNFADELGAEIKTAPLAMRLGIPVILGSTKTRQGLSELRQEIAAVAAGTSPQAKRLGYCRDFPDKYGELCADFALKERYLDCCLNEADRLKDAVEWPPRRKIARFDRLLLHPVGGRLLALLFLALVLYVTTVLANYPSELLMKLFQGGLGQLDGLLTSWACPAFLQGLIVDGMLGVSAVVLAVMIPPMAIFFPLFALLEEAGLFPRLTLAAGGLLRAAGASPKQCLTMCMGLGCNAAGVTQCRIISDRSQRETAIYTNVFMPCNGRFPTIILIAGSFFFAGSIFVKALYVVLFMAVGFVITLAVSALLGLVRGKRRVEEPLIELTRLRKPPLGRILVSTFREKTVKLAGRALLVALPSGLLIYLLTNLTVGGSNLLSYMTGALDPFGRFFGLDGTIVSAFLLSFPANEILLSVLTLGYGAENSFLAANGLSDVTAVLTGVGWTVKTAVIFLVFLVAHWPCATTLVTVAKETKSVTKAVLAFAIPTAVALTLAALLNLLLP